MRDYVGDFEGIVVVQTSGPQCRQILGQILGLPDGRLAIVTHGDILIVDPKNGDPCVTLPVSTSNLGMFGDHRANCAVRFVRFGPRFAPTCLVEVVRVVQVGEPLRDKIHTSVHIFAPSWAQVEWRSL